MSECLKQLLDFEIVVVVDDSGSMNTSYLHSKRTRWNALCDIVKIVLDIGVIFDSNGVDIYFLNQKAALRVTDPKTVEQLFARKPRGFTPLVPVLKQIFQLPATRRGHDKKLLVLIATDGAPTDEFDNDNVPQLYDLMVNGRRAETTFVNFLVCTDDPVVIDYFNGWDRTMVNVDVTQEYHAEKESILKYRGPKYRFSFGDYVVKALVGAVDPKIDGLDEPSENH